MRQPWQRPSTSGTLRLIASFDVNGNDAAHKRQHPVKFERLQDLTLYRGGLLFGERKLRTPKTLAALRTKRMV